MMQQAKQSQCVSEEGPGGFNFYALAHGSGSRAVVADYGAHVVAWRDAEGRDLLYMSSQAIFAEGKAIRGGIPLVFPQFGKGELPSHGFARTSTWRYEGDAVDEKGCVSVTFALTSNEKTLAMWPHKFEAKLTVSLSESLTLTMVVKNVDDKPFSFNSAFHTYFAVTDISAASIDGLKGVEYIDCLKNRERFKEERRSVDCEAAMDRIYTQTPQKLVLFTGSDRTPLIIDKEGMSDSVVWNPWLEGATAFADMANEEYRRMFCVESGNVATAITLQPGESHTARQILREV